MRRWRRMPAVEFCTCLRSPPVAPPFLSPTGDERGGAAGRGPGGTCCRLLPPASVYSIYSTHQGAKLVTRVISLHTIKHPITLTCTYIHIHMLRVLLRLAPLLVWVCSRVGGIVALYLPPWIPPSLACSWGMMGMTWDVRFLGLASVF